MFRFEQEIEHLQRNQCPIKDTCMLCVSNAIYQLIALPKIRFKFKPLELHYYQELFAFLDYASA